MFDIMSTHSAVGPVDISSTCCLCIRLFSLSELWASHAKTLGVYSCLATLAALFLLRQCLSYLLPRNPLSMEVHSCQERGENRWAW